MQGFVAQKITDWTMNLQAVARRGRVAKLMTNGTRGTRPSDCGLASVLRLVSCDDAAVGYGWGKLEIGKTCLVQKIAHFLF